MPRYFTLDDARAALPLVGRSIREAIHAKARYQQAENSIQNLTQRILMNGGVSVDTTLAETWKTQYDTGGAALKSAVERIEEIGVVVKDLDVGLVDFPTLFNDEEVYLCWRADEPDISHWHGVDEGFAGRKPIDRHFLDNHRGD
jgi:hypothetical protein